MKLARYTVDGRTTVGAVLHDRVVEIATLDSTAPKTIRELLAIGPAGRARIAQALKDDPQGTPIAQVRLEAPIADAQKYLAIGMNYHDHAEEAAKAGVPVPKHQLWFNKQVSCITGPYDPIYKPRVSDKMDYEAEMGVVIGRRCRYVNVEDARSVVGGYFVANDVTARDWQFKSPTFTLGKSFDSHGPIGPWITTDDEIADPHALLMQLWVNGELRQKASTGGMIYSIWQQIHELSQVMTLEPGDLIATGTCANVGIALGKFLQPGDVVRVEIEGLGHIENRVEAEPAAALAA
jgi:2-keto-4-pentenoate hydratase/2-oxohepta-3-ene-1,7-dioic acid hydratase in catechol pathway